MQVDKEAQKALTELKEAAKSCLTSNNVFNFDLKWSEPAGIASHAHKQYLTELGNTLFEQVSTSLLGTR